MMASHSDVKNAGTADLFTVLDALMIECSRDERRGAAIQARSKDEIEAKEFIRSM